MQETQASGTEMITLPPAARAAIALKSVDTEAKIKELVASSVRIVDVIDTDGRAEAHRAAMDLRALSVNITKTGKSVREDSNAFSTAVIAEERKLVGLVDPEKDRLLALRDKFDAKVAAEKAERERKEAERKAALQSKVDAIRNIPLGLAGEPSSAIAAEIEALREFVPADAEFYDYAEKATEAAAFAVLALLDLHDKVAAKEAADAAAEAERVEAARIAADQEAERQRMEALARAQAQAAADALAEEVRKGAAALAEQQAAVAEQQRVFAEQQAAFAAQQKAAADQLAADRAAIKAEAEALAAAKARADAEKLAAEEEAAAIKRAAAQAVIDAAAEAEAVAVKRSTDQAIFDVVADDQKQHDEGVDEAWLSAAVSARQGGFLGVDLAATGTDITTLTEVDAAGAVIAVEAVATFPNVIRVEAWETLRGAVFNALASEITGSEVMSAVNDFITEFEAAA